MTDDEREEPTMKELSAAAERVLQQEHPNPDRVGCPDRSILEQLANFSEEDPPFDSDVLRHVLTECYPCFRDLRELKSKKNRL
jgi:hypothetical protein